MIDVTVIGFGKVGASLSLLLLNNKHDIRLNVIEPDPQREGAFLDLAHGMMLYPNKELFVNNDDLFLEAKFIFYCAGIPNIHGGSRLSTAKKNIALSKSIFEGKKFEADPYVIVITNPVDIISHSVFQFSGLSPERVIGTGTFLDSVRLAYYLSTISDYKAEEFDAFVLGEHGDSQFPVYSMTKIKGESIIDHPKFSQGDLELAAELTKNAAFHIRETQEGTTYGVSKCAEILLDYLLGDGEHSISLSMLTNEHYQTILRVDHPIYISMPVLIKNGVIQINEGVQFTPDEIMAYQESAAILAAIV